MSFNENEKSDQGSDNMEQEIKIAIEEASVNLECVKKELEEDFEFAKKYKISSTYENIFGETSKEQRNNLDSFGFLDDDNMMKTETGTIKLEDVKEENENVIRRNIEQFQSEVIQCDCCEVWLKKEEHLESHMVHCLENYNRLSDNLPGFGPTYTGEENKVRGNDEISQSIDVDGSQSIPSTEIINSKRSCGIDCRAHSKVYFHGDDIGVTHSNISESSYQTSYKCNLKQHLNTHTDIKPFECDIYKKGSLEGHIRNRHSNTAEKEYKCAECPYQTNLKSSLKQHLNTHNDIKPFECDICKEGFSQERSLKLHIRNHHSNTSEKEYKCSECCYQTNDRSNLDKHLNTHKDIKPFECDICKKGFSQTGSLKRHIRNRHSNTSEKEYKCSECCYQTNDRSNLDKHLNTHSDIKPFECDICKERFTQEHSLKLHIRNHHSNTSEKEYKCSECCYQTNVKDNLKKHLNTHKDIRPFECDICKKGFTQKISLKVHIIAIHSNTHKDIKPFECDICKKRYSAKGSLKLHTRNQHRNTIEKEYKCSECSFQTSYKQHLRSHLSTHIGIKTFECDFCEKGFSEKCSLKNHIRNHHSNTSEKEYKCSECPYQTNDKRHLNRHKHIKPFECDICKKGFSQKAGLKKHIIAIHLNTRKDIKPFECKICKQKFSQKGNLQKHVRNQHANSNEKEYKCSQCSYQTSGKRHLSLHLNTHNNIKPFECDICKMGFNYKSNLKNHIRNQHLNSTE